MTETHHAISYIEINTHDLAAAKAFYGSAFGWEFNDYGDDYAGIRNTAGDGEVGGLNPARQTGPGGSFVLIYSEDLEATHAAVEAAGGQVIEGPYDFPGGGGSTSPIPAATSSASSPTDLGLARRPDLGRAGGSQRAASGSVQRHDRGSSRVGLRRG